MRGVLVLPDPDDQPSSRCEALVGVAITEPIGLDFLAPIALVRLWPSRVLRAPVPEASIHEDRDVRGTEDYVRTATSIREDRAVHTEAQSSSVQLASQSELRLGVTAPGA